MEKSDEPSTENEIWGTCEELLLACAVHRHGTHSWDSIATEIRCRSPYAHRLTAVDCKNRFLLLKSCFDGGDRVNCGDRSDEKPTVEIPWLDELRKLRVDELRRELRRHDASIGSLELKVKRLKEERELSLVKPDAGDGVNGSGSGSGSRTGSETDPKDKNDRTPRRSPENMAGDRISGEDSGLSCKESNSTEPKAEDPKFEVDRIKDEAGRAVIGSRSGSGSVNGSMAESKEDGTKESSDVQSSASLSRRAWRQSAVDSAMTVESQPLIDFIEMIRSNKDWSAFNHRLESQEGVQYRRLIRRHVDLEIVRNRIGTNRYTNVDFFRDLLLLCTNALVFYPKNSPESISALHLRNLINKEIAAKLCKTPQPSPQTTKEPPPLHPLPPPAKLKSDPDQVSMEKPATLPHLVACRKRSSIVAKSVKPVKSAKKVEKEEKVEIEEEEIEKDEVVDKKSTKQRMALSQKSRTSKGGVGGANVVKDPKADPVQQEAKPSMKKRGMANFLNRIRLSPSSSNGKGNEIVTKSSSSLSKGGGESQKEESKKQGAAAIATAAKRNVGRPLKGGAAPTKRAREEKTPPLPRKRGRR